LTGESPQTTRRKIKAGEIRSVQTGRGRLHRIPSTELIRLGFIRSLNELLT
jgi:excisionase family DNA binding protein